MKLSFSSSLWSCFAAGTLAFAFCSRLSSAPNDATEYPHVIAVELGAVQFAAGDNIVITTLRGDRPHLENGGRYLLEGTYTLASTDKAKLGWSITTRGPSGPTPVAAGENASVTRGTGTFRLTKTFLSTGWPHVSFYANGHSRGGVYFGEEGVEAWVLRNKGWSDFEDSPHAKARTPSGAADRSASANRAIMKYLGDPVPMPPALDAGYAAAGLSAAFRSVAGKVGWEVTKLSVDDSEFPGIVFGLIAGRHEFGDLQKALNAEPGYSYGGSVVGRTERGSTFFALNLTPNDRYPAGQADAARRRLMIRLQMLADQVQRSE